MRLALTHQLIEIRAFTGDLSDHPATGGSTQRRHVHLREELGVCLTFPQAQPPRPRSPLGVPIAALSLGPERP